MISTREKWGRFLCGIIAFAFILMLNTSVMAEEAPVLWFDVQLADDTVINDTLEKQDVPNIELLGFSFPVYTLEIPKGTENVYIYKSTVEGSSDTTLNLVIYPLTEDKTDVKEALSFRRTNGGPSVCKMPVKTSSDDPYIIIDDTMSRTLALYFKEAAEPSVKALSARGNAGYEGNLYSCLVGATFADAAETDVAKFYITDKEDGTSADALEGTVVEKNVKGCPSMWTVPEALKLKANLKAGKYYVAVELGDSRQYYPVTIYSDAKTYAKATIDNLVKWYGETGLKVGDDYVGLAREQDTGTDWEAYIFGALGYKADDPLLTNTEGKTYLDMKAEKFANMSEEDLVKNDGSAPAAKILSRQILGIAGLGGDPRDVGGKDLIKALISLAYKDYDIAGGELNLDEKGGLKVRIADNDTIAEGYFLLALEVCNATPEEGYTEEVRAAGLRTIINAWGNATVTGEASGDFSGNGSKILSDYYSMTLYPLYFMNDVEGMEGEANKLLENFAKNYQQVIKNGSKMNVFSVAVATSALATGGLTFDEYTTDAGWQDADGQYEISKLLSSVMDDGSMGVMTTGRMATYEVFQGLVDIYNGKTCFVKAHETFEATYPQYSRAVQEFNELLKTLPAADKVTLNDENTIAKVRAAYDKLTDGQKEAVGEDASKALTAAEAAWQEAYKGLAARFTDVKAGDWFFDDVVYALHKGIMVGMTETTFGPDANVTRGQFVTILGRYAGIKDATKDAPAETKFKDVAADQYYASHVAWAAEKGIVKGTSETTFDPNAKITRQDMCVIMARYAAYAEIDLGESSKAEAFGDDEKIADYAKGAVYSMRDAGIINGMGENIFAPQNFSTRAQAAKVIHLLLER